MKINKSIKDAVWVDYEEGVRFNLRPAPTSMLLSGKDNSETTKSCFCYAIVGWEGIEDMEGNPLPCNDENKAFIFDYVSDITTFISNYLGELRNKNDKEIKN